MVIEYALYCIPGHKEKDFVSSIAKAAALLKANDHCVSFSLRQSNTEVINFIMEIGWHSIEGHVDGFRRSNHYIAFLELVLPYAPFIKDMDFFKPLSFSWERPISIYDFHALNVN
jgi:quinol monooxygenase YgiN